MITTSYSEETDVRPMTSPRPARQLNGFLRHHQRPIPVSPKAELGDLGVVPLGEGCCDKTRGPSVPNLSDQVAKIARVDLPVLLVGKSSGGKKIMAKLIHDLSSRRDGPFQELRCTDSREDVLERELFGSTAKDNSGFRRSQVGRLDLCRDGTLVLDEITALPSRLQARLVDLLDSHALLTVGEQKQAPLDVRILATTREDAAQAVASGKLRRDLYYRLQTLMFKIPPLQQGREGVCKLLHRPLGQLPFAWASPGTPKLAKLQNSSRRAPFLVPWQGLPGADLLGAENGRDAVGFNTLAMTKA